MLNKKTLLICSGIFSAALFVADRVGTDRICLGRANDQCIDAVFNVIVVLVPVIPLFVLSLITYKMRDAVSRAWMRFALVWIPLSIILAALTPNSPGGGFGPQISLGKGDTTIAMSLLFILISLVIIAWKYMAMRKG